MANSDDSPVLVFGLAGQLGAGCSFVRDKLVQELATYGYAALPIDITKSFLVDAAYKEQVASTQVVSEIAVANTLIEEAERQFQESFPTEGKRIAELQQRGNEMREAQGADVLARLCVSHVIAHDIGDGSKRVAYVIDSLKHPKEVEYLRGVFREAFFMVGVVASDARRRERLRERKHIDGGEFDKLSRVDGAEGIAHGQSAIKTVLNADYFIRNDHDTKNEVGPEVERVLQLLFDVGINTPTLDENGMHHAWTAALRSGCLSRQVGASILTVEGNVVSVGCNDVPCFGGGLYRQGKPPDRRCWTMGAKCYNDDEKAQLVDQIVSQFAQDERFEKLEQAVREVLSSSAIKNITEYTRAVHAEMDAILAAARSASRGLVGSTLYVTDYPCHNCAKHIICAGLARVVYFQPYEKSRARKLHSDAINDPLMQPSPSKVTFDIYGGVAPHRYQDLFRMKQQRKSKGSFIDRDRGRDALLPARVEPIREVLTRVKGEAAREDHHGRED